MIGTEYIAILPIDRLWPPKGLVAQSIHKITQYAGITSELITLLQQQDLIKISNKDKIHTITIEDALTFFKWEIDRITRKYPEGYRYNYYVEKKRKQAKFFTKCLKKGDYKPLIRYCLDESLEALNFSRKKALAYNTMPEEKRLWNEKQRELALEAVKKFHQTHDPEDIGFPPEIFNVSGKEEAYSSQVFYGYAICLAKAFKANKSI